MHRLAADLEGEGQELARRVGVAPGLRSRALTMASAPAPREPAAARLAASSPWDAEADDTLVCLAVRQEGVRPGRRRGEGVAAMHRLAADLEGEGQELARRVGVRTGCTIP
jgi:hypothetical protein